MEKLPCHIVDTTFDIECWTPFFKRRIYIKYDIIHLLRVTYGTYKLLLELYCIDCFGPCTLCYNEV